VTRWCVVTVATIGAALAGLLGAVYPWWVVLLAEAVVAAASASVTYGIHERLTVVREAEHAAERVAKLSIPRPYRTLWDHPSLLVTWVAPDGTVLRQMGGALRGLPVPAHGWAGRALEPDSTVARILPEVMAGQSVYYALQWGDTSWCGVAAPYGGSDGHIDGALYVALLHPPGQEVPCG
jgi:hypothetical protein